MTREVKIDLGVTAVLSVDFTRRKPNVTVYNPSHGNYSLPWIPLSNKK